MLGLQAFYLRCLLQVGYRAEGFVLASCLARAEGLGFAGGLCGLR